MEYRAVQKQERIAVLSKTNHRFLRVLEAIMFGVDVDVDGNLVRLCESATGALIPAILVDKKKGLIRCEPGMSIAGLSNRVAQMSEQEFERISFELALEKLSFDIAVSKALKESKKMNCYE
jgi:hypothetical protein